MKLWNYIRELIHSKQYPVSPMHERKADPVAFIENKIVMKRLLVSYIYKHDIENLPPNKQQVLARKIDEYIHSQERQSGILFQVSDWDWKKLLNEVESVYTPQVRPTVYEFQYFYRKYGLATMIYTAKWLKPIDVEFFPIVEGLSERLRLVEVQGEVYSGETFVAKVELGEITDNSGYIGKVFVDGWESNIGLAAPTESGNFCQGKFLLTPKQWRKVCKNHKIEVVWCN